MRCRHLLTNCTDEVLGHCSSFGRGLRRTEGMVTAEIALGFPAIVSVLAMMLWAGGLCLQLTAMSSEAFALARAVSVADELPAINHAHESRIDIQNQVVTARVSLHTHVFGIAALPELNVSRQISVRCEDGC